MAIDEIIIFAPTEVEWGSWYNSLYLSPTGCNIAHLCAMYVLALEACDA